MAYKDEYEVARLHLEEAARLDVSNAVGENVKVYWNLHPPALRALGMRKKLTLGPWFTPAMVALRSGRRIRGSWADPFRYAGVRKVERELITQYEDLVQRVSARITPDNADVAVQLANLPDLVRGYEDIKLANVERYQSEMARLRSNLGIS